MPTTTSTTIRIALLLCDTPNPAVSAAYGNYLDIYTAYLQDCLASFPERDHYPPIQLIVDGFDVIKGEYPSDKTLSDPENGYTAVMMTGSQHTSHNDSLPWIPPLVRFVNRVATSAPTQHVRIVGICFGMQIVARAMGGVCEPNEKGWEIGVYEMELTREGEEWLDGSGGGRSEKDEGKPVVAIQQMHRDHVPSLPPSFTLLGSTPKSPVHGMLLPYPSSSNIHILCLQGHPEFIPPIVNYMIDARSASGLFDEEVTKEARWRAGWREGGEGRGRIGWGIWRVLLQDLKK